MRFNCFSLQRLTQRCSPIFISTQHTEHTCLHVPMHHIPTGTQASQLTDISELFLGSQSWEDLDSGFDRSLEKSVLWGSWAQNLGKLSERSLASLADINLSHIYTFFIFSSTRIQWGIKLFHISYIFFLKSCPLSLFFLSGSVPFPYSHKNPVSQAVSGLCGLM